ncbi:MAG: peptide chain release factor N(5)-glutamine methyltransferase [Spirochaetes bacterium]|jgi:release factor glutamine methyltransferase|nr:peptide chain release factor N(5)-glutamine methyltransferase [Spirochaetota bacterium]
MTLSSLERECTNRLNSASVTSSSLDAQLLLCYVLNISRERLLADGQEPVSADVTQNVLQLCERRQKREPLAYIVGVRDFYTLSFNVTPDVLIPRPETEMLVDYIISSAAHGASVLDLCTGSGAIAISIKHERPDLSVSATDICEKALDIARQNSKKNDTDSIHFYKSDLFDAVTGLYDIVVTNPPYVPEASAATLSPELSYEPSIALFSGNDGLNAPRAIIELASLFIVAGGELVMEIDSMSATAITELAEMKGLSCSIFKDLAGLDRMAVIRYGE